VFCHSSLASSAKAVVADNKTVKKRILFMVFPESVNGTLNARFYANWPKINNICQQRGGRRLSIVIINNAPVFLTFKGRDSCGAVFCRFLS
jgi:hypothetical protein